MSTNLIASVTGFGALRSNFGAPVGCIFLAPATNPLIATALGRWVVAGNSGTHTIYLCDLGTGILSLTIKATTSVNTSGATSGQFLYGAITPVQMVASHYYAVLSVEVNTGDQWYDNTGTTCTVNATVAQNIGNAYDLNTPPDFAGFNYNVNNGAQYVPCDLQAVAPSVSTQIGVFLIGP